MNSRRTSGSGTQTSKHGVIGSVLLGAGIVGQIPTCPDLIEYRVALRPALDRVIGGSKEIVPITVDRENIFRQAISYYKRPPSKKHVQLMVTFKSDGVEEQGYDGLGLRREFYCSFFKECLKERNMFVGEGRRKLPSNDMTMIQNGYFEALGRAIVASILNGDCGFPYLAPVAFYYLVDEDVSEFISLKDVPDLDIKYLCENLMKATSNEDILSVIESKEAAVIDHIGWPPGQSFTMKNRDVLVEQLIRWSVIDKRKSSLDKLKQGLNHMGFLEATKKNPQLLPLLVYSKQYSVSANYVRTKFLPHVESLDCKNEEERLSKRYMIEWMKELQDPEAQSLFQFVTGSADPPVEEESVAVEFNSLDRKQKFPSASTCNATLRIPQGNKTIQEFRKSVNYALENAKVGFGES